MEKIFQPKPELADTEQVEHRRKAHVITAAFIGNSNAVIESLRSSYSSDAVTPADLLEDLLHSHMNTELLTEIARVAEEFLDSLEPLTKIELLDRATHGH